MLVFRQENGELSRKGAGSPNYENSNDENQVNYDNVNNQQQYDYLPEHLVECGKLFAHSIEITNKKFIPLCYGVFGNNRQPHHWWNPLTNKRWVAYWYVYYWFNQSG